MDVTNALLSELELLAKRLNAVGVQPIIGGGMGLYLRQRRIGLPKTGPYDIVPPLRPTQDIDNFVTADVIVDGRRWQAIRNILDDLGWIPDAKFLFGHFLKVIDSTDQEIKLDLLSAIPAKKHLVQLKGPRIRPLEPEVKLHARIAAEAAGIEFEAIPLQLTDGATVLLPSSFNYLVLKLHAFRDSAYSEAKSFGRHHALDIFRTILMMRPEDWDSAARHKEQYFGTSHIAVSRKICREHFASPTSIGVIRLKENVLYRALRAEYDEFIARFLEDLFELFDIQG